MLRRSALGLVLGVATAAGGDASADRGGSNTPEFQAVGTRWSLVARARTGSMPWGVSVSPDGGHVVVTHVGQQNRDVVWRYSASPLRRTQRAHFRGHGTEPLHAGGVLYVTNSRKRELLALDPATLRIQRRYRVGNYPKQLAAVPGTELILVANWHSGTVSVVDTSTGKRRDVKTGRHTRGVTASVDGRTAYATNFGGKSVAAFDIATGKRMRRIRACRLPRHVVPTGDGAHLLVSCFGERRVLVIDTKTEKLTRSIRVGKGPKTIAVAPNGRFAVTANERDSTLSIIDLQTFKSTTHRVGARGPCGAAVSPDSRRIYLTARRSNQLVVFESAPAN